MKPISIRGRAVVYMALLAAVNVSIVEKLFFVEFTDNMQTNDGSFLGITRYILAHFPHLTWFPQWFNGLPFENTYTPMLHLMDAAFAWTTGSSPAHAYNFVTGFFYAAGPVFLFLFAWRLTGYLEASFFASLLYSLYSPAALFPFFRGDVGFWNPWRLRVLVFWGEGPHITMLAVLPLALLAAWTAISTRRYVWCAAAAVLAAWLVLVNAFGATAVGIGCACMILALPAKERGRAVLTIAGVALAAYLLACVFLPPSLLRTISYNSQFVDGDFRRVKQIPAQAITVAAVALVWLATLRMRDVFLRFALLFATALTMIVGLFALFRLPALPQAHRYSVEMEMAICLIFAFALRPLALRLPRSVKRIAVAVILLAAVRQTIHYTRYARRLTAAIDVTQTADYKVAKWMEGHLDGQRTFVSGETGTWLNAFSDVPQMNSGHQPFDPNFQVDAMAVYTIYSGEGTAARDADISILWLKALGCGAIHVAPSRLYGEIFHNPRKFDGVLPVLWREGKHTIYGVPQRTQSLARIVPEGAIVRRQPVNGIDTGDIARYVAALDDPSLPADEMKWPSQDQGHIETTLRPGQVLSMQTTYDPGWMAIANGKAAAVTKDGLGMSVIHADCDGPCTVDFTFDGGVERKICRALSGATLLAGLITGVFAFRKNRTRI
jgi:hypothetical protein